MKIKRFIIQNYKAIRGTKEFVPDGASFFLLGGNGKGKTSAGHALIDMLTKTLPNRPITEGENVGYLEFEFTNGAKFLARMVDGKKPQLEFITPDGYNISAPKDLLQRLSGEGMDFSVDEMLKLQPKPLREKMEKIAGLDLSAITLREQKAFEDRKLINAKLRDQQGRVQPYEKSLVDKEPSDPAKITAELEALLQEQSNRVATNHQIEQAHQSIIEHQAEIKRSLDDVIDLEKKLTSQREQEKADDALLLEEFIADQARALEAFKQKLVVKESNRNASIHKEIEEAIIKRDNRNAQLTERIEALELAIKTGRAALDNVAPPDVTHIEALRLELSNVAKTNQDISDAKRLHEEFLIADKLEREAKAANELVEQIRLEKDLAIQKSPLPARGLSFSPEGELLIDGLPFEDNQIATSRKLQAGIEIAESLLGDIKYLHIDGAAFDKATADAVLEFAESKGLQLCIEHPSWEGGELKFEVVDLTAAPEETPVPETTQ